jgi:hypothetical protein
MTMVRVLIDLPYFFLLPYGEYLVGRSGPIFLTTVAGGGRTQTRVFSKFEASPQNDREFAESIARSEATKLIRNVNRFLRWYRQLVSSPGVLEVTRSQVSPFWFRVVDEETFPSSFDREWIVPSLQFEPEKPIPARFSDVSDLVTMLREKLATADEPDVADLNLLDAQHAKRVGRFREAVLLSWSVIDSSFLRKFERLVDEKLKGEWGDAKQFLKGHDFGLRHKMTSGLRLVAARSFFDESNGFWDRLSTSYHKRNAIIHKGDCADEDDAELAIGIALKVLQIIGDL